LAVPIPIVALFRKIKNLVKNHGVVAAALQNSTQLVSGFSGWAAVYWFGSRDG
jgi:La-related protein 7